MIKKLVIVALTTIMVLSVLGLTGCSNGKTIEVDG